VFEKQDEASPRERQKRVHIPRSSDYGQQFQEPNRLMVDPVGYQS